MWTSVIYFLIVTIGLGFLTDLIIKDWKADFLEKLVMRLGIGIAIFTFLGVILNLLHIPLDWKIYLIIAITIFSAAAYFRKKEVLSFPKFSFSKITKQQIYSILLLIMFAVTAYMYIHGSFVYPWLEDGDPYGYSLASKYIAEEKTFSTPFQYSHYAEPYTQGYQILMGVLHQTNDSIYWTMKFFNALIISLSLLFFYYFAKRFTENEDIAIVSTFALFAIPCWVGHFVFSLNFNMALFPVLLYCLVAMRNNNKWKYILALVFASVLINHVNTAVTILMLLGIYYINYIFVHEDLNIKLILSLFGGFILSLLYYIPIYIQHSDLFFNPVAQSGGLNFIFKLIHKIIFNPLILGISIVIIASLVVLLAINKFWFKHIKRGLQIKNIKQILFLIVLGTVALILILPSKKLINLKGSGTRAYTLADFFVAQKGNMTNNPIGVGIILMSLFTIGIIFILLSYKKLFEKENFWISTTLIWVIFSLIIILGVYHSVMYLPFRMWTFFAIPASLIIGFAVVGLAKLIKKQHLTAIFIIAVVILVIPTSFAQKYWHNTAVWPEHQIFIPESQKFYVELRDGDIIPKDSHVYPLCHQPSTLYGYDMHPMTWANEELSENSETAYFRTALNKSIEDNYQFLKRNEMEYVVLGASCVAKHKFDVNLTNQRLQEISASDNFELVYNTQSEFLFSVK